MIRVLQGLLVLPDLRVQQALKALQVRRDLLAQTGLMVRMVQQDQLVLPVEQGLRVLPAPVVQLVPLVRRLDSAHLLQVRDLSVLPHPVLLLLKYLRLVFLRARQAPPDLRDLPDRLDHRVLPVQTGQTGQTEAQDLPDQPEPPQGLEHLPLVRGQ